MNGIEKYIRKAKYIFDIGTGPNGSDWWHHTGPNTKIDSIDIYFFPDKKPRNVSVYKYDASKLHLLSNNQTIEKHLFKKIFLKTKKKFLHKYDLIVANHVLEHVESPQNTIAGISNLIAPNGIVYTGFPDGFNFTDIFYHLIHPEGGGHIQRLTAKYVISCFSKHGFKLLSQKPWPDDWLWLQKCFDYKSRGLKYTDQKAIDYLAKTFRRELTAKKGYYYGWELIFQKK